MTGRVSSHVQSLLGYLGLVLLRWGELGDGPLRILCNASSALIAAVNAACSARSASNSLGRTALFISGYPILNCTLSRHYRTCQSQQYPHLRVVWGGTGDRDIFCVAEARCSEVSDLATAKNNWRCLNDSRGRRLPNSISSTIPVLPLLFIGMILTQTLNSSRVNSNDHSDIDRVSRGVSSGDRAEDLFPTAGV